MLHQFYSNLAHIYIPPSTPYKIICMTRVQNVFENMLAVAYIIAGLWSALGLSNRERCPRGASYRKLSTIWSGLKTKKLRKALGSAIASWKNCGSKFLIGLSQSERNGSRRKLPGDRGMWNTVLGAVTRILTVLDWWISISSTHFTTRIWISSGRWGNEEK